MLFDTPTRPATRQLRQFAVTLLIFTTVAVVLRWLRHGAPSIPVLLVAAAGWALAVIGVVRPRGIEWLFVAATSLTAPIGRVVSEVMLVVLYFGVITPMALVSRLVKRDRLNRTIDRSARTYWMPRHPTRDGSRYFRQS